MSTTFVKVPGTVKFFNLKKGYGFIQIDRGDIFIHVNGVGKLAESLRAGDKVIIDHATAYRAGRYVTEVTRLHSITPGGIETLGTVKFFNPEKGYGFIRFVTDIGLSKTEAIFSAALVKQVGLIPDQGLKDMPVRVRVAEAKRGPEVVSFEWGEAVEAAWQAAQAKAAADPEPLSDEDPFADLFPPAPVTVEAAPAKPKRIRRKKADKPESTEALTDIAAVVATCAKDGAGGALAEAFQASIH